MSGVSFEYIDGSGGTFSIATACRKLIGFGGMGLVAPTHFWQNLPDQDGSEHLGYRVPRRVMNVLVKTASSTRSGAWTEKGSWGDAFRPSKGQGRLKATLPDGTEREIPARFVGGLDWSTQDSPIPTVQDFPVQLVCDGPYWEDPSDGTATANFSGTAAATLSCTNSGDVSTHPKFVIDASVSHPVLTLGSDTIDVNVNVSSGSLVIDCSVPSVELNGASRMGSATTSSKFFELASGANSVQLTATSGSGLCTATWTEKYEALKP